MVLIRTKQLTEMQRSRFLQIAAEQLNHHIPIIIPVGKMLFNMGNKYFIGQHQVIQDKFQDLFLFLFFPGTF